MGKIDKVCNGILRAVIEQLGEEDAKRIEEVADYRNANGGWTGFTYYTECSDFFMRHRKALINYFVECAENCGISPWDYAVKAFRKMHKTCGYSDNEICLRLFCGKTCDGVEMIDSVFSWIMLNVAACHYKEMDEKTKNKYIPK